MMGGFLIDTNVLSEYNRPDGPDTGVRLWLETTDRSARYVSAITLAEIQKGIELLVPGKRRSGLQQWLSHDLESVVRKPGSPHRPAHCVTLGSLVAESSRAGRPLPTIDSFIAATALTHDLTIVTRNVRDFEGTGIVTLNPWRS